ncbi:MAG: SO_0444 family Cu/Zn efflux transporter [Bacteroidaceae bacterium]|nr:SO_0444 family Cu/Zn efflux transporter [Bacteroidaceae bacterium]
MQEVVYLITGMSPYLLLGFLLAGLMHAFVPGKFYTKYLSRKSFRSVLNAALLGIPLPLCSCGVIPTAMSLRKEGASKGAVVSFLIATPQTGVDSIIATFSLMGLPFAIVRPIAALFTAIFGGVIVDKSEPEEKCHCHSEEKKVEEHSCCCHSHKEEAEHVCHCHSEEKKGEGSCHCHSHKSFFTKIKEALTYAYVDMMEDIGKWLVIGLVVAAAITVLVPTEYFAVFQGNTLASMLLVLCIAMPMYLCATGSIPIAVALMMKGLTPGAALVMLMAGPACNFASMLLIRRSLGLRTMLVYILSIVLGAVAFGYLIDMLQFSGMVDFLYQLKEVHSCHEEHAGVFSWICTGLLLLLLVNALVLPKLGLRKKKQCCHCH